MKAQKLNRRQVCQTLYLLRSDFTLEHVPETKIEKVDKLSRRLDQKIGVEKDNENQTLIKEQQIHSLAKVVIEEPEVEILEKIKIARRKDKKVVRIVEEMKKVGVKVLRGNEWQVEGNLMLKERKVYVPKDKELRVEIIQLYHNVPAIEYEERQKMTELVTRNYQWPGMTKDVGKYLDGCNMCQRMKNYIEIPTEKLIINEILKKLQAYLMVDFITKLLLVARKNTILVVCNRLFKTAYFIAIIEGILVKGLAQLFRNNIQKLHRLPESMISDKEPQFVIELIKKLNKMLGIEMKLSMSFYLQIDSQTKRIN